VRPKRATHVLVALFSLAAVLSAPGASRASLQPVEYTRAVSYWYVPTGVEDVFRLYQLDVYRVEDLATGAGRTSALVVTDRCKLAREDVMVCGNGRREQTTSKAELQVAEDLSGATAKIRFGKQTSFVRFEERQDGTGAFELDRRCSTTDVKLVIGMSENMGRAHGRVLGRRLDGPYSSGWDHAWVERGHGNWCEPPSASSR